VPAEWPEADFIIGNPPFLGSKVFRQNGLPDDYVAAIYGAYDRPKTSDLCCYWFEQARRAIQKRPGTRVGLLATQGIRGGDNRTVLERIKQTGEIFMAWSDRDWILDGANVHVSIIGFGGKPVAQPPSAGQAQPGAAVLQAKPSREIYRRNLPHIQAPERPIFITFCTLGRWVLPPSVRSMVVSHCLHDNGVKHTMHGLVVMPDHVHLILSLKLDTQGNIFSLSEVMNGIKGASSHSINKFLGRKGHLWQDESYDHVLRSEESLREAVEYICANPVRKGLADRVDDWPWLWREWVEGVAQPPSARPVAQPPSARPVAQPPSAGGAQPGAAELQQPMLDGRPVSHINPDLTADADTASARVLAENRGLAFMADTKGGAFDISGDEARFLLAQPNPNGRPNSDVLRPWVNGADITKRRRGMWIVDFGCETPMDEAAGYEGPFRVLRERVEPERRGNRRATYAERWWIHVEPRPAMRQALPAGRVLGTPRVTKFRLFTFLDGHTLADAQLIVFARSDDYFFGVLHSSIHELWARRMGTQLREVESGFRYTPTTCFETFPLPWPPGKEPVAQMPSSGTVAQTPPSGQAQVGAPVPHDAQPGAAVPRSSSVAQTPASGKAQVGAPVPQEAQPGAPVLQRIAEAARELNDQRERWLNPSEWIDPIAQGIDSADSFADVPPEARPLIRQSFIMAAAARDPRLKKRTLTNLYNERPTWLRLAHEKLDRAVLAAYAAADPQGGWSEDWADVWKDTGAGQPLPAAHPLSARRAEIDQKVLANLLRLNLARA
jgi:REP element-mobilizing transposase RayT